MKLPFRRRPVSRGQALVEFAIILPLLALMLMLALDFGRVFFGWVALNNAARIAANAASVNAQAWNPPGNGSQQTTYKNQVVNDLNAINCRPPGANNTWQVTDVPNPTFDGSALQYDLDHHVVVALNCRFTFLTPIVGNILGNILTIGARADFTIRGGEVAGVPIGASPPPPGCVDAVVPNMVGQSVAGARSLWTSAGFTGAFTPATGNDTETVLTQVTSPASSPGDCLVKTAVVTVTYTVNGCVSPSIKVPNLVGMTVSAARTAWTSAGFTGSFSPSSGSDTDTISAQTTNPSSSPGQCEPPTTTVSVTHAAPSQPPGTCQMPQLVGLSVSDAKSAFTTAGFSASNFKTNNPPNGNYIVTSQDLTFGQYYACTATVTVAGN
jgi:beta-lactam-binding protein with PASTA domain